MLFANYASAYVFYRYLAEKFGGSNIVKNLVNHSENGIKSIEQSLNDSGYVFSFPELFRNWTIANFLNNISLANGSYGYENLTFTMDIEQSYSTFPISRTENSIPYPKHWGRRRTGKGQKEPVENDLLCWDKCMQTKAAVILLWRSFSR